MLKRLLVANLLLISTTTMAYANTTAVKGVYKGVYKGEVAPPPPVSCLSYGPYIGFSLNNRINYTGAPAVYNGIEGDAILGYSVNGTWGMFAAELFGGNSVRVKNYLSPDGISIQSSWSGGISVLPGATIANNLIAYLRLGYVRTHFKANNPDDPCDCNDGINRNGWQVGVGGQSNIIDNLDIRGEYIYSQFRRISYIGTPRSHQFGVSLLYRFA